MHFQVALMEALPHILSALSGMKEDRDVVVTALDVVSLLACVEVIKVREVPSPTHRTLFSTSHASGFSAHCSLLWSISNTSPTQPLPSPPPPLAPTYSTHTLFTRTPNATCPSPTSHPTCL
jgi:hypothetical protein